MDFDWGNFVSTLVGAFAGALGAYWFNIKQAEKQQKEIEKAKMIKLFYDISILIKVFSYHYSNTVAEINNLTEEGIKSLVPITIKNTNFSIEEYGFIPQFSPKLYEILTYVYHDINYIYEQQAIATKFITKNVNVNVYLDKLNHIKVSTVKLLAKLFVSLINLNNALVKYHKCNNLIKDEVVFAYIRAKRIIEKVTKEYQEIIKNPQNIDKEDLKTVQVDLEYINEILNTWTVDFMLNNKQKTMIETEIKEQIQKKREVVENDL